LRRLSSSEYFHIRWLNGTLRDAREGSITIEFVVREEMTNPMGILHGGITAAIMDDVIGTTVYSLGREYFYTSVNLVIDYLASAQKGETITASAQIIRAGKTIVNAQCEITNAEGKVLARGTSNLLTTSIKIPDRASGN
jgi:acyl-coenzyme A thioesterase 13